MAKTRIHVYSFGITDSSGGFFWTPIERDPGGEAWIRGLFEDDVMQAGDEWFGVLAELRVAGYAPDTAGRARITEFIEGELQDAIAAGLVGKIIGRYGHAQP